MADSILDNYMLESLKTDNEKGILQIYQTVFPKVKNYILSNGGYEDDAKDVMQKSLMQVAARVKQHDFKIKSSFEGYLFITCKNVWVREQKIRKTWVTNDGQACLITEEQNLAQAMVEQNKWELFQEKLEGLSENCRNILNRFFNKVSYKQIADEMGYANENVVKQRIFKCKNSISEAIKKDSRYAEIVQ